MLKVHAIIKKYKSKPTANVMFRVRDGQNVDLSYTSDIQVEVNLWDNVYQGYPRKETLQDSKKELVNQQIFDIIKVLREVCSNRDQTIKPTSKWLKEQVSLYLLNKKNDENISNLKLVDEFEYYIKNHDISDLRRKSFKTVFNSFVRFQAYYSLITNTKIVFKYSDINFSVLTEFRKFLNNEYILSKTYPELYNLPTGESISRRGNNTIVGYMKKLSSFICYYKSKYNQTYNPFENYKIGSEVYGNPIVLTKTEFQNLQNVGIVNKQLQIIRDIFLLNCMTGFRVADFFNLKYSDIINGKIEYYPSKTRKHEIKVSVPLNEIAKEIISKYKSDSVYLVPRMSFKTYRIGLKKLFKTVGLTRIIPQFNSKTNEIEYKTLDQLVSAHLARRVFLSILVNMGYNSETIYSMSGHRVNSKEISRYYCIEDSTQLECVKGLDLRIPKPLKTEFKITNEKEQENYDKMDNGVGLFELLKIV